MKKILTLLAVFMVAMTVNAREPITSEWDLTTFETKYTKDSPITENLDDYICFGAASYTSGTSPSGTVNYSTMSNGTGWKSFDFDISAMISIQPQTGAMLTYVELTFQDADHSPSTYAPTSVTPDGSEIVINENKVTWSGKIVDGQFTLQFTCGDQYTSGNLILTKIKVTYQRIWELVEHERTDYHQHEYSITNGSYSIETNSPDNTDLTISNSAYHDFEVLPDTPFDLDLTDPVYLQNSTTQYQIVAIDATGLEGVKMRSIVLPASLTTLGGLLNCEYLSSVTFEEGSKLTEIGLDALSHNPSLKTLVLPEGLKEIGPYAFGKCPNLESISFPKTLESLSGYVFAGDNPILSFKSLPSLYDTFKDYGDEKFTGTVNVELTDDSYVYTGNQTGYTIFQNATSIGYTRTMANQWGTIVLPFAMNVTGSEEGYDFYELTSVSDDNATLTLTKKTGDIAAGTPLLVRMSDVAKNAESGKYELSLPATDTTVSTTSVTGSSANGLTLTGAFSTTEITDKDGYIISNNAFWKIADIKGENKVYCSPFRAYLAGTAQASKLSIGFADEETTIETLNAITSGTAEYYDLNGRRLNDLQKGVNIVKSADGTTKKVIVK